MSDIVERFRRIADEEAAWRGLSDIIDRALNEIDRLTAENARLANPWQPIETAPKDENIVIDVWCLSRGRMTGVRWLDWEMTWGRFTDDSEWETVSAPTHWMPVPAEPPR